MGSGIPGQGRVRKREVLNLSPVIFGILWSIFFQNSMGTGTVQSDGGNSGFSRQPLDWLPGLKGFGCTKSVKPIEFGFNGKEVAGQNLVVQTKSGRYDGKKAGSPLGIPNG